MYKTNFTKLNKTKLRERGSGVVSVGEIIVRIASDLQKKNLNHGNLAIMEQSNQSQLNAPNYQFSDYLDSIGDTSHSAH